MRVVAQAMLAAGVVGGLGCTDVVEHVVAVTGTHLGLGQDATLPDGFPLDPPGESLLLSSVRMELGGYRTTTVQVGFPSDPGDLLPQYVQEMQLHGMQVTGNGGTQVTGTGDGGTRWTVEQKRSKTWSTLTFSVLEPTTPPPAPAPDAAVAVPAPPPAP